MLPTASGRRRSAAALFASCASLLLAPPAIAAPATTPVSGRSIDAYPVALAFDGSGRAIASWRGLSGATVDAARTLHSITATRDDGSWRAPPVTLPATVVAHDLAVTGPRTAALVTWRQKPVRGDRSRSQIVVTLVDTGSWTFRRVRTLASGPARPITYEGPQATLLSPRVAATPDGGLVIAWLRSYPRRRAGVWVATMRPDGRFGTPRRLGPNGGDPVLTVGKDGSGLLAWRRGHRVQTRFRCPTGRWGRIETAAMMSRRQWAQIESLNVAADGGRFAVGVLQTVRTMAGVWTRSSVHVRVPGAGWRSGVLGEFTFVPTMATVYVTDHLRVLPLVTSDNRLIAVWPALVDGHVRAMAATLVPEARAVGFGLPFALSPATTDVALEDAAAGPDGDFAVTWFDLSDGRGTPGLAEVDASGAVRSLSGLASERALFGAQVAYHPVSGRPMVVWSEGDSAPGYHLVSWTSPASG
jgi:hypothetical protein